MACFWTLQISASIESLALEEEAVLHLPKLPDYHRDPFDRMLIAQAREENLTLVSQDSALAEYRVDLL